MFKNIIFHALIGGAIFLIGASLHDFAKIKGVGSFLAIGGMVYAGVTVTTFLILIGINLPIPISGSNGSSLINKMSKDRKNKKARSDLLEYKKLLDEGILSQKEFDSKAAELKKLIL